MGKHDSRQNLLWNIVHIFKFFLISLHLFTKSRTHSENIERKIMWRVSKKSAKYPSPSLFSLNLIPWKLVDKTNFNKFNLSKYGTRLLDPYIVFSVAPLYLKTILLWSSTLF